MSNRLFLSVIGKFGLMYLFFSLISCESQGTKSESDEANIYAEHVRSTEFQSPSAEQASFVLPPGFKVTLFASEPDITKPINMAFDQRGRLWVTQSSEYPIAAGESEGGDKISILEDSNGDGKADKITEFANDLNIPIGILPMKEGVIAYSIPNVNYYKDHDGDDVVDEVVHLLGPFGHEDTHGMVNNFARGYDGWIYGCHGFSNTSTIGAQEGDSITMVSGNTFRFDANGQHLEQTTYGRVNPFGYAFDEWGYLYSADCHSRPLYQLVPQGNYPHFGKKPPSLGFGPEMMDYNLGSTAIAGLALYSDNKFPVEFQNCFYAGDVVTCRVDRIGMEFQGSTPIAQKREPLLVSKDPWFRPVDVKMGPDGAIYVADFYNRIIGHYEVPLDHKGRDRISGRIWKITYEGEQNTEINNDILTSNSTKEDLIHALASEVLKTRMDAADILVDNYGQDCASDLMALLGDRGVDDNTMIHGMWILHRLERLPMSFLNRALSHNNPRVQVHGIRMLSEYPELPQDRQRYLFTALINGDNPHVNRASAEVLGHFTAASHVAPLIQGYFAAPEYDSHLAYTCLLGLQLNLRNPDILKDLWKGAWLENELKVLIKAVLDISSQDGAEFVMRNAMRIPYSVTELETIMTYIAANGSSGWVNSFLMENSQLSTGSLQDQFLLVKGIENGLQKGGKEKSAYYTNWSTQLAKSLLVDLQGNKDFTDEKKLGSYQWAIEQSGHWKDGSTTANQQSWFKDPSFPTSLRVAAAKVLLESGNSDLQAEVLLRFSDHEELADMKIGMVEELDLKSIGRSEEVLAKELLIGGRILQIGIAEQLSHSISGSDILLKAVADQGLRLDVLQQPSVIRVLKETMTEEQQTQWDGLEETYGDGLKQIQSLIDDRRRSFEKEDTQVGIGQNVFKVNCAICHQVDGEGKLIGPQLDGIGNWGERALINKVLDPNRNISPSFRTYFIELKDGSNVSGLYRREEGEELVLANAAGEEFSIAKKDIASQTPTTTTLMPNQFGSTLSETDFNALINYLLSLK